MAKQQEELPKVLWNKISDGILPPSNMEVLLLWVFGSGKGAPYMMMRGKISIDHKTKRVVHNCGDSLITSDDEPKWWAHIPEVSLKNSVLYGGTDFKPRTESAGEW